MGLLVAIQWARCCITLNNKTHSESIVAIKYEEPDNTQHSNNCSEVSKESAFSQEKYFILGSGMFS